MMNDDNDVNYPCKLPVLQCADSQSTRKGLGGASGCRRLSLCVKQSAFCPLASFHCSSTTETPSSSRVERRVPGPMQVITVAMAERGGAGRSGAEQRGGWFTQNGITVPQ